MAKKAAALKAFQASDPDLPQLAIPPTILEEVQDTRRGDSRKIEGRGGGEDIELYCCARNTKHKRKYSCGVTFFRENN